MVSVRMQEQVSEQRPRDARPSELHHLSLRFYAEPAEEVGADLWFVSLKIQIVIHARNIATSAPESNLASERHSMNFPTQILSSLEGSQGMMLH